MLLTRVCFGFPGASTQRQECLPCTPPGWFVCLPTLQKLWEQLACPRKDRKTTQAARRSLHQLMKKRMACSCSPFQAWRTVAWSLPSCGVGVCLLRCWSLSNACVGALPTKGAPGCPHLPHMLFGAGLMTKECLLP